MLRLLIYVFTISSLLTACYPMATTTSSNNAVIQNNIYYLGDTYPKTDTVDAYYDEFAVKQEYIIIGSLTNVEIARFDVESMKNAFSYRAQLVGADALIFDPLELSFDPECKRCLRLKARAIRYMPTQN